MEEEDRRQNDQNLAAIQKKMKKEETKQFVTPFSLLGDFGKWYISSQDVKFDV